MHRRTRTRRAAAGHRQPPGRYEIAFLCVLGLILLAGGATRGAHWSLAIVQLAALALLPFAGARLARADAGGGVRLAFAVIAAIVAVPIIQLLPLPWDVWTTLPGRQLPAEVLSAAGLGGGWRSISLSPEHTVRSALALIPAIAVFLAALTLDVPGRRRAVLVVLLMILLGLLLGAAQLAGGVGGAAYFYEVTNADSLVGQFANRNHMASFLLCGLPLTAAMVVQARGRQSAAIAAMIGLGAALVVMLALIGIKSRAGLLLLGPAALGSMAIVVRAGLIGRMKRAHLFAGLGVVAAIVIASQTAILVAQQRYDTSIVQDVRVIVAPQVWSAALQNLPFGTGLGVFDYAYRTVEAVRTMGNAFINHAHNDYLEIWLEAGLLALPAFGLFLVFWGRATLAAWTGRQRSDAALAQAASVATAILMLHSGLDYPLRTLALSALFGLCCALMVRPRVTSPSEP